MNVVAVLPFLILHYDNPTKWCMTAAENIADVCFL